MAMKNRAVGFAVCIAANAEDDLQPWKLYQVLDHAQVVEWRVHGARASRRRSVLDARFQGLPLIDLLTRAVAKRGYYRFSPMQYR